MSSFVVRSPLDLVALVPVVIGFHPQESLVLLTFGGAAGGFHARVDLPTDTAGRREVARLVVDAAVANHAGTAAVLVYTDDEQAAARCTAVVARRLEAVGVDVLERLRVAGDRYFSLGGRRPDDARRAGTPYDLRAHPLIAERVLDGQVLHSSRKDLEATLLPDDGEDGVAAVAAAADALRGWGDEREITVGGRNRIAEEGRWLQRAIPRIARAGVRLSAPTAARLVVAVGDVGLRDVAWSMICRDDAATHVDLWRDLVRRTPRERLPPVASLLAFAAWLAGDGALAWCALDTIGAADPPGPPGEPYSMASLVAEALQRAVPPTVWTPPAVDDLPVFGGADGRRAC